MTTRPDPVFLVSDLDLMPDDASRYEVIDGELLVSKAPSFDHQLVSSNLHVDFALYPKGQPYRKGGSNPGDDLH